MATLHYWQNRKGSGSGRDRAYVQDLLGQTRETAIWIEPDLDGGINRTVHTYRPLPAEIELAARAYVNALPFVSWDELRRACGRNPAPRNPGPEDSISRAALSAKGIVQLAPAARQAGIRFRNGLTKDEIIETILRAGEADRVLQIIDSGFAPAPKREPKPVSDDWGIDDSPAPTPAPVSPPMPVTPEPVNRDDSHLARVSWVRGELDSIESRIPEAMQDALAETRAKLAELMASRPVEITFPELPKPLRVDGLTHPQFLDVLRSLRAGLHCMLVGPAGAGKTYAAEQAAGALGRKFFMQGAVSYAHELLGYIDAHSRYVRTQFRDAFEHGGLILLDEFDASAAEAALVLNAALANGACAFPDGLVRKHEGFLCVVGANTDGSGATMSYAGRARLDGAFLDRFIVFDWGIDPRIEESMASGNASLLAAVRAVREFARKRGVLDVVATPRAVKFGATLLASGMDRSAILARTMRRGAMVECWRDVEALPEVRAFVGGAA